MTRNPLGNKHADSESFIQILNVAQPSGKFWVGTSASSDCSAVILTSIQSGVAVAGDHYDIIGNIQDSSSTFEEG